MNFGSIVTNRYMIRPDIYQCKRRYEILYQHTLCSVNMRPQRPSCTGSTIIYLWSPVYGGLLKDEISSWQCKGTLRCLLEMHVYLRKHHEQTTYASACISRHQLVRCLTSIYKVNFQKQPVYLTKVWRTSTSNICYQYVQLQLINVG